MGIHISKLSLVRAAWQEYHKHESKQNMQWCVHHYCFVLGWCPPRKSHLQLITLTVACVASLVITTSRNFQNDLTNGFAGILLAAPRDCNWLRNLMLDITSLWPYKIKSELIKCASWAIVIHESYLHVHRRILPYLRRAYSVAIIENRSIQLTFVGKQHIQLHSVIHPFPIVSKLQWRLQQLDSKTRPLVKYKLKFIFHSARWCTQVMYTSLWTCQHQISSYWFESTQVA